MKLKNTGFDHVEFITPDLAGLTAMFKRLGFEKVSERHLAKRGLRSELWQQGHVRLLANTPDGTTNSANEDSIKFMKEQAEGITVLALEVEDAISEYNAAISNGARSAASPQVFEDAQGGRVTRAEVWTPGRIRYAFITRTYPNGLEGAGLFDEGLNVSKFISPAPYSIHSIDHLTNNIGIGEMDTWTEWYQKIFDFKLTRHFHIKTGRTGLNSYVVESHCGRIKVPINEATEPESQVQEFVNRMKGSGVQHLAFLTTDIVNSLESYTREGFKFLKVPDTYYDAVPTRIPNHKEDLNLMKKHQLLLDGDEKGYIVQIFTEELIGPFFLELIERKNHGGFGEGNFRALFEAIERDQIKRGVLK